jgi:hypothetical protein
MKIKCCDGISKREKGGMILLYLEEFGSNVFVDRIVLGEFEGHVQPINIRKRYLHCENHSHIETVKRHPGSAIGLAKIASSRQRLRAVEGANIIQPKEATFKHSVTAFVFPVNPPGQGTIQQCIYWVAKHLPSEIEQQFLENTFEESKVFFSCQLPLNLENSERRPSGHVVNFVKDIGASTGIPCMHRRINIAKVPLVRRDLPIRRHIPFPGKQV